MRFKDFYNNINEARIKKPRMHDCYIFDEINLNDYSKEFIKDVKKLGRAVRAGHKFLYSRNKKLGQMDEIFWKNYGYKIDEAIEALWDNKKYEKSGELERFVKSQGWEYGKYSRGRMSVGDFMC